MNNNISKVIIPEIWKNAKQITAAFTTKIPIGDSENHSGDFSLAYNDLHEDSEIDSNRKHLLELLDLTNTPLVLGNQVHGNNVRIVNDAGFQQDTDGLVTSNKNLALGILVADCAAILMADRNAGVIAAVHAGWRGAIDNIVSKAINSMEHIGAHVNNIEAFISPCISQPAFEVGTEVAEKFPDNFVDYRSYPKPHVDLKGFVIQELVNKGVSVERVESHPACTYHEANSLHSFRRDKQRSGRMMAIISMK